MKFYLDTANVKEIQEAASLVLLDGRLEGALLMQLKEIDGQASFHPLNRRHKDFPVTKHQRILSRVVRLQKNL
ncbi:MAG TPA: hypothetical protein VK901_21405 [Nitrospiraceae bacterium]|nr:hypothetical protein [Nitrospiraceae bacterium]